MSGNYSWAGDHPAVETFNQFSFTRNSELRDGQSWITTPDRLPMAPMHFVSAADRILGSSRAESVEHSKVQPLWDTNQDWSRRSSDKYGVSKL